MIAYLLLFYLIFGLGLSLAVQSRLGPYLASPELQSDVQPRHIRVLSVPDYYPEYRETGNAYGAFLGTSIIARVCVFFIPHAPY